MKKQPSVIFSNRIRSLSKGRGLTQVDLAKKCGVSQPAVSKWYNGSIPEAELLPKIANLLDVSVDYLLGEAAEHAAGIAPPPAVSAPVTLAVEAAEERPPAGQTTPPEKKKISSALRKLDAIQKDFNDRIDALRKELEE